MNAALPPDRGHIATEQRNPASADLHRLDAAACVALILAEDRRVMEATARAAGAIAAFVAAALPGFASGGRLVYLGAGTSGRLGVLDASEAPPTFQVPPDRIVGLIAGGDGALRRSSEGREDDPGEFRDALLGLGLSGRDAVLGIAAGGTTPCVHGALALAAALPSPPLTGLLACTPMERPACAAHLIVLDTGPEVLTGSTRMKAGSATKMALNAISTTLMVRTGKVYRNLMVDLRATNLKLRDRAARILADLSGLDRPASLALLERAGGAVKTAAVMHRRGVGRDEAERLLAAGGGLLGPLLDAPA